MKNLFFACWAMALLLFLGISETNSQIIELNGLSQATMTGTVPGENVTFIDPYTNTSRTVPAVLVVGTIDGDSTLFYCTDLRRTLSFPLTCHRDSAIGHGKTVYIMQNYYPHNQNPSGAISPLGKEVAATQVAVWHFSDGVDVSTVTDVDIRNRALQIVADANTNGFSTTLYATLSIHPSIDLTQFHIRTQDQNGDPISISGIAVTISDGGILDMDTVATDGTGLSPDITVMVDGGVITATAIALIPGGVTYTCPNSQRMLLSLPTLGKLSCSVSWGALPVELSSFFSIVTDNEVKLNWQTSSEINNARFEIERKKNIEWETIGSVVGHGNGTSNAEQSYQFVDRGLQPGKYQYRLKQVDFNGNHEYHNLTEVVKVSTPDVYKLEQNYPNPFNPTTTIEYILPQSGQVTLKVYDNTGRMVQQLVGEYKQAGYYTINFDGSSLGSGIYYYHLTVGTYQMTKKMMLVK